MKRKKVAEGEAETKDDDGEALLEEKIFAEKIKTYLLRSRTYEMNRWKMFSIVYKQCSEPLKAKLKGQANWETIFIDNDLVELLKAMAASRAG